MLVVILLARSLTLSKGWATPSPPPAADSPAYTAAAKHWLKLHNTYRCIHGAPPLGWSEAAAANAQQYVDSIRSMTHAKSYEIPFPAGPAGENLGMGQGSAAQVVRQWYDEWRNCASFPGCTTSKGGMIGHFTAMIWSGATQLGCAHNRVSNIWICRYLSGISYIDKHTPNINGAYEVNVFAPVKDYTTCAASSSDSLEGPAPPPTPGPAPAPAAGGGGGTATGGGGTMMMSRSAQPQGAHPLEKVKEWWESLDQEHQDYVKYGGFGLIALCFACCFFKCLGDCLCACCRGSSSAGSGGLSANEEGMRLLNQSMKAKEMYRPVEQTNFGMMQSGPPLRMDEVNQMYGGNPIPKGCCTIS